MSLLVTGGAGFIGSNFVLDWTSQSNEPVINLDKLTYAGKIENLQSLNGDRRHVFVQGDIGDSALVNGLLAKHQPRTTINLAPESHVDRSIHGPEVIAYRKGFINAEQLEKPAQPLAKNGYGQHLQRLLKEGVQP